MSEAQDPPYSTYATNTLIGSEPHIMKWDDATLTQHVYLPLIRK